MSNVSAPASQARAGVLDHPARAVTVAFVAAAVLGTVLLWLPVASTDPGGTRFVTAAFTATSALSVTGLAVVDTAGHWSPFGETVILVLMQIGGLGIMTATSLLGLVVARRLGLRSRLLVATEAASPDLGTVTRLLFGILRISLVIEALAWVAITLRLWLGYDEPFGKAVWYGLFHAVSAFNNGGFALWPDSLTRFGTDLWLLVPISLAFLLGAIGYPVLLELLRRRRPRAWSVHTKLTLVTFAVVTVAGTAMLLVTEWPNAGSIGVHGGAAGKLVAGVFSGICAGSAGFNVIDYGQVDAATRLVTDVIMFIGGGSGGTAGGVKLTTVAVLAMAVVAEVRGDSDVEAFGRRLSQAIVRQSLAVVLLAGAMCMLGTLLLLEVTDGLTLDAALFEVVSAFSSSGLSTGITGGLSDAGQYLLTVLMFVGRVGPITFVTALALRSARKLYRLPEARPLVG